MVPKRQRAVTTKPSKSGCRTCRIRRIKCDETRPHCVKCTSTGRSCDGYAPGAAPLSGTNFRRPLRALTTFPNVTSVNFRTTEFEQFAFNHFRRETILPLWQVLASNEWIQLALQMSLEVPAVFHAIAAVGSAHRAQVHVTHQTFAHPEFDMPASTLEQHCRATASLRRYIDQTAFRGAAIEPIALCCALLICFEVFVGRNDVAFSHLHLGRVITQKLMLPSANSHDIYFKTQSELAMRELTTIFEKLGSESLGRGHGNPNLFQDDLSPFANPSVTLPLSFTSLDEAKDVLDSLLRASNCWKKDLLRLAESQLPKANESTHTHGVQYALAHCYSRIVNVGYGHRILHREADLRDTHTAWLAMLIKLEDTQPLLDPRPLILMQIQHFLSKFTLITCRQTTETPTDLFETDFARILDLAEQYLGLVNLTPPCRPLTTGSYIEPHKSLSLAYGILPTLYLICLKCRSTVVRCRATEILRCADRREGVHWSKELATYAEAIVQLEEQRARTMFHVTPTDSEIHTQHIPEAARFSDVVIEAIGWRQIKVICTRFQHEQDRKLELVEFWGTGATLRLKMVRQHVFPYHCEPPRP